MGYQTKESLQRMFNQSKLRQEQKKQIKKQQSLQRLREIYHHQDIILKKSLQERKKTTMDNLSKLIKKTQEKPQKPAQIESYSYYQEKWQLWETNQTDLYQTFEELMEAQERGEGRINVENWNKLVQQTKDEIKQWQGEKNQ